MATDAYKVIVTSGDGNTPITKFNYFVPRATNGEGSDSMNVTAARQLAIMSAFCTYVNGLQYVNCDLDARMTLFTASSRFSDLLNTGMNLLRLKDMWGADLATNDTRRFYFNTGAYILAKCTYASGGWFTLEFKYYRDGTLYGTTSTTWTTSSIAPFPFVLRNLDGTITDYTARSGISELSYEYTTASPTNFYLTSSGRAAWQVYPHINLQNWFNGITPFDADDPYPDIPDSEPSGPAEPTGIPETAQIDIPDLPTVSVVDTGFISMFNPSLSEVKSLANYMWAGLFDINTFRKIFADPMDCILGFNMLPCEIPDGAAGEVVVGNITTGIQMTKAASQWVELDCGSVTIGHPYASYLDHSPYTKFHLYLPYIGTVDLSCDDVMGKALHLVYHIDVLSCSCVAYLKCGDDVLYQFTGSCGYSIPITSDNFRQMIANIVSIAATLGGAMATGGMSAPLAAAKAMAVEANISANVMNAKPEVHRSGAIGASAGMMGIQKPYIIAEYPRACKPKKQYHYTGYPSYVTVTLGDLSGYAAFEEILVEGVPCTEEEQTMIKDLCMKGIYL